MSYYTPGPYLNYQPEPPMRSSKGSRMAIDALLNPDGGSESRESRMQDVHHPPQHSPHYPPSSYYYSPQYSGSTESSQERLYPYQSRSTDSSPDPYSRDRYDSVSSGSSAPAERRRPPRPKYEEEEMYFIWYHRVDLGQEWKEVRECFNRQFPDRQRRGFQGIQCKFYRFIKDKSCPTLREQRRMRDGEFLREGSTMVEPAAAPKFGVVEWAGVWYPWMRESRDVVLRNTPRMALAT